MAVTRSGLFRMVGEFSEVANRLALRAEHWPTCDTVLEPSDNAACTCGLADLLSHLEVVNTQERKTVGAVSERTTRVR
jgi:hypothetical protein